MIQKTYHHIFIRIALLIFVIFFIKNNYLIVNITMEIKNIAPIVINKKTETALNAMINDKLSVLSVKNSVYRYVALKQFYQVKSVQKNEEKKHH